MRQISVICMLLLLTACGGGSSGKSSGSNPPPNNPNPPPEPTEEFTLGGTAAGLSGPMTITNGREDITVSDDGTFAFTQKLERGSTYNVRILSLPPQQLCEIRNGRSFITRDRDDIEIECANMVELSVDLSDPLLDGITGLRLLSNYDAKGGNGEDPVDTLGTRLRAFQNTFVTLTDGSGRPLFMLFVDDLTTADFVMNAHSTAIALMLLEPSISIAVLDRSLEVSDLQTLISVVNINGALDALASAVGALIESQGFIGTSASAESTEFYTALNHVLLTAAEHLAQQDLPFLVESVIDRDGVLRQSGVEFTQTKTMEDQLGIRSFNWRRRNASLNSSLFADQIIPFSEEYRFEIETSALVNNSFDVDVVGPGVLGTLRDETQPDFINASVASSIDEYLLRSTSLMLGLVDPAGFLAQECLQDASLTALTNTIRSGYGNQSALLNYDYQIAFRSMARVGRDAFVSTYLAELFSCDKFGASVFLSGDTNKAVENVSKIFSIANAVYRANDMAVDLVEFPMLHQLSQAINTSHVDATWRISNLLNLSITADPAQAEVGDAISFAGECLDPESGTTLPCSIDWDFGDGNVATGAAVQHTYNLAGEYDVVATATGEADATSSQTLRLLVDELEPEIEVKSSLGLVMAPNDLAINYGSVPVGSTVTAQFSIENRGNSALSIDSITQLLPPFTVAVPVSLPTTLQPDEAEPVSVEFTPAQLGASQATLTIGNSDADEASFPVQVSGSGVSGFTASYSSGGVTAFPVAANRTSVLYNLIDDSLQLRFYGHASNDFPRIIVTLRDFDPSDLNNSTATYSIDATEILCDAWFFASDEDSDNFCTNASHVDGSFTGSAIISDLSDTHKQVLLQFDAVQTALGDNGCTANCESVAIRALVAVPIEELQ